MGSRREARRAGIMPLNRATPVRISVATITVPGAMMSPPSESETAYARIIPSRPPRGFSTPISRVGLNPAKVPANQVPGSVTEVYAIAYKSLLLNLLAGYP